MKINKNTKLQKYKIPTKNNPNEPESQSSAKISAALDDATISNIIRDKVKHFHLSNNSIASSELGFTFLIIHYTFQYEIEPNHYRFLYLWLLILLRGLLYLKVFVILHDMGHDIYFKSSRANNILGNLIAWNFGMDLNSWKRKHNFHHKSSNDLCYGQEFNQTAPLTMKQFLKLSSIKQKLYIFVYSPKGLVLIVPTWYIAVVLGVLLFHGHHTFEGNERKYFKDRFENGLKGSSFIQIPYILRYFTYGIEYHHIHHIDSRIPCYCLRICHIELEKMWPNIWKDVKKVNFADCLFLDLLVYDEENRKFLGQNEIKERILKNKIKIHILNKIKF